MTNVALVILDTLRKDAFDEHFDWLPGKRFHRARSPSHWTVPVHAGMFTGRYASELGVYAGAETLDCPEQTIAERLSAADYTTRAFSCNPFVSQEFDFDRGFDSFSGSWRLRSFDSDLFDWNRFIDRTRGEGPQRFLRGFWECARSDCDTVASLKFGAELKLRDLGIGGQQDDGAREALDWLQRTDFGDREFLFLNLMEAHTPYDPPPSYQTVEVPDVDNMLATVGDTDVDGSVVRQAYDDCVRYLSEMYEQMFAELTSSFDIVITVSDHGELFGEHGVWEHSYGIYPELTHVPLVVSGDVSDDDSDAVRSLIDVHATVLSAAGVDDADTPGISLLESDADRSVLTEYHGLQPRKWENLTASGVGESTIEAHDERCNGIALPESYYGYETINGFVETGFTSVADPQARLAESRAALEERRGEDDGPLSDVVTDQLGDLGYL